MKFTYNWLKKFLDIEADIYQIADACNQIGHEVEEIVDHAQSLKHFIIAKIHSVAKHPNADKLKICIVDDGEKKIQVVCGANNVNAGEKIVFASPGVIIPSNGMKIRSSKIRGVESNGMICSAEELGLTDKSDGIMIIDNEAKEGDSFVAAMPHFNDPMIHLSITPNRPDCLGVYGIARDLAAKGIGSLKEYQEIVDRSSDRFPNKVAVAEQSMCMAFSSIYISDISNKESPCWLKHFLEAVGCSPRNFAVDVTNYINFSFARPLHVYDADKISGGFNVRLAKDGEEFLSLDGKKYALTNEDVVVSDEEKVLSLAGIIGGESTKCESESKNIIIESALWDSIKISASAKSHQIDTDSKFRFERGVDYEFAAQGALLASKMILEFCGGKASQVFYNKSAKLYDKIKKIFFSYQLVEKIGGLAVSKERANYILRSLGFKVAKISDDAIEVYVPAWRHDIAIQEDLVEEILRIEGYDNIPSKRLSNGNDTKKMLSSAESKVIELPNMMASRGYDEVITWSFVSSQKLKLFEFDQAGLKIANPINEDLDCIRPSIIPNLVDAIILNNNRGFDSSSMFEIGPVYQSSEPENQFQYISGIRSGVAEQKDIFCKQREFDIFDVKKDVEIILEKFGYSFENIEFNQSEDIPNFLHPSQAARIFIRKQPVGLVGTIHPAITQKLKIKKPIFCFEINLDSFACQKSVSSEELISDFQSVERDFAFLVEDDERVGEILKAVKKVDGRITRVRLFDLFTDGDLPNGKKSIAFRVKMQSSSGTLDSEIIDNISDKIISVLETRYHGNLRN
ncbi:MAG: phenylalanine--tRNA ligase subunit beta [Rickettsiales bacterium]